MSDIAVKSEERKTFAEWIKQIENLSFAKSVKSWLEKHNKTVEMVVEFELNDDLIDITEDDDKWKNWMGGPYHRIKLTFNDGTEIYGKSFYYKGWDIKEDKKENWGYIWVRQRRSY